MRKNLGDFFWRKKSSHLFFDTKHAKKKRKSEREREKKKSGVALRVRVGYIP